MIAFVEGRLEEKHPTRVVLLAGGVGYEIFIPLSSYDRLPEAHSTCRMLTVEVIREDAHLLYGFMTEAERDLFRRLIDVSGIGPKIALSALSGFPPREFKALVLNGDAKRLSTVPGIGKKTAERIILEMKDKISEGEALDALAGPREAASDDLRRRDAVLALISLGYKQIDAVRMVQDACANLDPSHSVEDIVRRALTGK
jgi:holliday junction DNA helicase RuvA